MRVSLNRMALNEFLLHILPYLFQVDSYKLQNNSEFDEDGNFIYP